MNVISIFNTNLIEGIESEAGEGSGHEDGAEDEDGEAADGVAEDARGRRGQELDGSGGDGGEVGVEGAEAHLENSHGVEVEGGDAGEPEGKI